MRKLAFAVIAASLAAAPALAEDWDFMLTNATGKTIKTVDLAPTGSDKWTPNKVDAELRKDPTIKAGTKTTIRFDKDQSCKYDVKATFEDGTSAVWSGINVCNNSYLTLKMDSTGKTSFSAN